jgi:hypothetical protein
LIDSSYLTNHKIHPFVSHLNFPNAGRNYLFL